MSAGELLTHFSGGVILLLQMLWHAALWQRKEYRFDRIRSLLQSAERRTVLSPLHLLALGLIVVAWLAYWAAFSFLVSLASTLYMLVYLGLHALAIWRRGLQRPVFTLKATTLLAITFFLGTWCAFWIFRLAIPTLLGWITLLFFLPYLMAGAVVLNNIPYALRKYVVIAQAQRLRARLPHLTVIGITGSFGKTSTKFFIQQLLGATSEIAITADRRNAPYVVAQDMLTKLTKDIRYYVVEMGAYRQGEIRALTKLTLPQLGVVTGIGNQHLALFGSLENLANAKWELVESLPPDGIAILNVDNQRVREKASSIHCNVRWFSTQDTAASKSEIMHVRVIPVTIATDHVLADVQINGAQHRVTLPLVSEALLPSAAAAATVAQALGVSPADIFSRLENLTPYAQTMQLREGRNGSTVIDDSYSANEEGVKIALRHLQRFVGRKPLVVLRPLEELGAAGIAVHERLGAALATLNQPVFLVNDTYREALQRGLRKYTTQTTLHSFATISELQENIVAAVDASTVVLLEGRMPDMVRKSLILST